MNKCLTAILLICMVALAGCAGSYSKDYAIYAKAEALRPLPEKKPLFKMTAQEGQPITGLASLEVYAPDGADALAANRISPPIPQENVGLQLAKIVVGGVVGIAAPAAQVINGSQQARVAINQALQSRLAAESNNTMLGGMFTSAVASNATIAGAGFGANTSIATGAFASMDRGYAAAFAANANIGMRPTTQIIGDSNNIVTGTGNTTQSGSGNRIGSAGPCTAGSGGNQSGMATPGVATTITNKDGATTTTTTPTTTGNGGAGGGSDCAK